MEVIKGYLISLGYMVIGLAGTGLVIFIHELGHYTAARICRVNVEILSFGFGRPVFSHMGKNTQFRISLIPFGGYCRLGGSEDLTVALSKNDKKIKYAEEGSLFAINPFKKLFIYASGPLTNIILAFLLFTVLSLIPVERVSHMAIIAPVSDYKSLFDVEIEQSSILKGDIVTKADGRDILDYEDLESYLLSKDGEDVALTIQRDDSIIDVTLSPVYSDEHYTYGITNLVLPVIGRSETPEIEAGDKIVECNGSPIQYDLDLLVIDSDEYNITLLSQSGDVKHVTITTSSFPFAFKSDLRKSKDTDHPFRNAYKRTISMIERTAKAIMKLMTLHIKEALEVISGPFTSATNMGRISLLAFSTSASSGIRTAFYLLAIVSISIAVGNILPIPTFDGGQMLICLAEIICHRPLKPRAYLILHIAGLVVAWTIVIVMNSYSFIAKLFSH